MSQPVVEFGNNLNWDLIFRETKNAVLSVSNPGYYYIPPKTFITDSNIIAVGIQAQNSKGTWIFGGRLSVNLFALPSVTSEFTAQMRIHNEPFLKLGILNIVQFPNYGLMPVSCELSFPHWFDSVYIEAWKYSGVNSTTVEESLSRIETKIDSL